jgi:hypothetical protein
MNFSYECPNCGFENQGDFTPARPAPNCSNPSSPAFSDSGDDAEWDGEEECVNCGEAIDMERLLEKAGESIELESDQPEDDDRSEREAEKRERGWEGMER